MLDMSGAAEIPATRLFGRSPQRLNATGESDLKIYDERIGLLQETHLRPAMEKLLPVLEISAFGFYAKDSEIVFEPIATTTPSEKVPRERLRMIMEAGLAAPSGCNKQTTSLIAVDNPALLKQVFSVIDPPIAVTAPAMICVLTRRINAYRDRCFAVQDYSAAIENMLLMISALGYASCWYEGHITDTDRIGDKIAKVLNVPEEYDLVCLLPVGIPDGEQKLPKKMAFDERAWFNYQ